MIGKGTGMKEQYLDMEVEVVEFEADDIIVTSSNCPVESEPICVECTENTA